MSKNNKGIDGVTKTIIRVSVRLIIYALMILVMIKGATMAYSFGHGIFYAAAIEPEPGRDVEVIIPGEMSVSAAAEILKEKGLISNKLAFEIQARFFEYKIKPGTYLLNTSQTSRQMLDVLNTGQEDKAAKNAAKPVVATTAAIPVPTSEIAETLTPSPEGQETLASSAAQTEANKKDSQEAQEPESSSEASGKKKSAKAKTSGKTKASSETAKKDKKTQKSSEEESKVVKKSTGASKKKAASKSGK